MNKSPFRVLAPCKNCPFRRDVEPYLSPKRVALIQEELEVEELWFPCHNTMHLDDDGKKDDDSPAVYAGFLKLIEKLDRRPRFWRMAILLRLYQPGSVGGADVYDSFEDMKEAQAGAGPRGAEGADAI